MPPFSLTRAFSRTKKTKTGPLPTVVEEHSHTDASYHHEQAQGSAGWKSKLKRKKASQTPHSDSYGLVSSGTGGPRRALSLNSNPAPFDHYQPPPVPASNAGGTGHLMVINNGSDDLLQDHHGGYVMDQQGQVYAQDHFYPDGVPRNHTGSHRHHTGSPVQMTHTGQSHRSGHHPYHNAPTIIPADSVSNVGINTLPGPNPLLGRVEEESDIEYVHAHHQQFPGESPNYAGRGSMMFASGGPGHMPMPIPQVHTGGTNHRVLTRDHTGGTTRTQHTGGPLGHLPPLDVRDANGVPQKVHEILLDGSGTQEIPMPADGNVVFIVEEGVTLEVKDPISGEFVPLEEYYANLAQRRARAPVQANGDQYIVVNGDAANLIVEDSNGNILHRGASTSRSGSDGDSYVHQHHTGSTHHVRHHDNTVVHLP